jgi:hypothetical protein
VTQGKKEPITSKKPLDANTHAMLHLMHPKVGVGTLSVDGIDSLEPEQMSETLSERLYHHAMGLAQAMTQHGAAVDELLVIADRDEAALRSARSRTSAKAADAISSLSDAGDEADEPQTVALVATRLLDDAISRLTRR